MSCVLANPGRRCLVCSAQRIRLSPSDPHSTHFLVPTFSPFLLLQVVEIVLVAELETYVYEIDLAYTHAHGTQCSFILSPSAHFTTRLF